MPAVPQDIINDVAELILNHIRQTNPEGDQPQPLHPDGTSRTNEDKLRGIDEEIHAIEATLASLQATLNLRGIIQCKRKRNNLIRFNRLPLEIASNILWLSIADPWQRKLSCSFIQRLQTISSVCSSWRTLVESSPRFWSIIEFSSAQPVILDLLRKSGSSGLEIKCFSDGDYNCAPPSVLASRVEGTYLNLIAPHTDRIRSLILSAPNTDGLFAILQSPAPILEEIRLNFAHCFFVQPLDLFCGQVGRLRDVALENIPFRWDSAVLAGLRSLKIRGRFDYSPTAGQVRRLLEENPGLETMDIEDVTVTDPERFADDAVESSGRKPSRVAMSKMQKLRLCGLPFELVQAILENIEIPSIKHFDLTCLFRGEPASTLLGPNTKHLVPPLLQGSQGTHLAEITFGRTSVRLGIYLHRQDPTIRIELQNTTPMSGFGWLADSFFLKEGLTSVCQAEMFQVSLNFGGNFDMAEGTFIPILERLGAVRVKALTLQSSCLHREKLIDYLGEASEDSQWPLPHLMSLTVGGREELADQLLMALLCRKDAPPEETLKHPRPVMLEVLDLEDLHGVNRKTEKALAQCVSSSGTFIRGSWRRLAYDWEDFDDEVEEDSWNGSESGIIYSPMGQGETWE